MYRASMVTGILPFLLIPIVLNSVVENCLLASNPCPLSSLKPMPFRPPIVVRVLVAWSQRQPRKLYKLVVDLCSPCSIHLIADMVEQLKFISLYTQKIFLNTRDDELLLRKIFR